MKNFNLFLRVSNLSKAESILGFKKQFWLTVEAKDLNTALVIARIKACFTYSTKKISVYYPLPDMPVS